MVLNIKKILNSLARHVRTRAQREPSAYSILDLRGLGKATWHDIDAAAHVAGERASWEDPPQPPC